MKDSDSLGLFIVLLIATVLRLWGFSEWSLSNDELSAIHRLNVNGISELFSNSIKVDGHPALSQLFLYFWTSLFGKSVFAIRLPFVLMSSAGVYFFYKSGKLWFNEKASLLATSVLALSQYFILFGSIARPYAMGFFLISLFTFYWSQFLFQKGNTIRNTILMTLFASLTIMTHYFAALSIILQVILGSFYLIKRKDDLKKYALSVIGIILLCLPHLKITLFQLSLKGLSWLPLADENFFNQIVPKIFNESYLWLITFFMLPLYLIISRKAKIQVRKQFLFIALTLFPILIGYYYSLYRSPVLHLAVLYFCLPFLPYFIASFIPKDFNKIGFQVFFYVSLIIGISSLNFSEGYRGNNQRFANFKGIVEEAIQIDKDKKTEGVLHFANANHTDYLDFYTERLAPDFTYDHYSFTTTKDIIKAEQIIDSTTAQYISVSYALKTVPVELHEYIKDNFGPEVNRKIFFNSGIVLYERGSTQRDLIYESTFSKENHQNFYYNGQFEIDSISNSEILKIGIIDTFPIGFYTNTTELITKDNRWINARFHIKSESRLTALIIVELKSDNNTTYWNSFPMSDYFKKEQWYSINKSIELPKNINKKEQLSIYIWNLNGEIFRINNFSIRTFVDSDYNYFEVQ